MFLFQMKIALKNLADPPIVMTEERFNLKDIDPPLLTICPQDQIDEDKLRALGYTTYRNHLLKGKTEASRNISFWKNFDDALKFSPEDYTIFFLSRNKELSLTLALVRARILGNRGIANTKCETFL